MTDATAVGQVAERIARVGEIEIAYDTFGDPGNPALLLVMGLGMQLIAWDAEFCTLLADRGFHVIRFDNRDVGHSSKVRGGPRPNVAGAFFGFTGSASYTLDDMAEDSFALLDHLGIRAADVVGASMGAMIAQMMAIRHPERVRSLASIMSTTGSRLVGQPRLRALGLLLRRAPRERSAYIEHALRLFKLIGSPGYPSEDERIRALAAAGYDRCFYPAGIARQIVAIAASGDRTRALRRLPVPTVVIHGRNDPLVPLSGGRATARAIPGARLVVIPGMGHDLPRALWPTIVDEVAANAERGLARQPAAQVS